MVQIHKRFTDEQAKELIEKYLRKETSRDYLQEVLEIGKTRFFELVTEYRRDPSSFSLRYVREQKTRSIPKDIEENILKELTTQKQLIEHKEIPIRSYNYSYIKDHLEIRYKQHVSLPTIIDRARKNSFYLKKPRTMVHDREVLTHYAGELIQHDSSHHLWAPQAREKWYLVTSLDDFSRFILYAQLFKRETSWAHILSLESLLLRHGIPFSYYVDSHSIFRFVQNRDSLWREHHLLTDEANPQWKQVLNDCNVKVIYALSPQAKGKIERPYQWLQDRLVRTCVRDDVSDIRQAQKILGQEIHQYNYRRVHSTTREVPYIRLKNALDNGVSLFRSFKVTPPYESPKDIFCLRIDRVVDSYRKVSINNLSLKINKANPHETVNIRIYPMNNGLAELRFWCNGRLADVQRIKQQDLNLSTL
jgi:hypothetical protein